MMRPIYNYLPYQFGSNYLPYRETPDYNVTIGFIDYNNVQIDPICGDYDNSQYVEDPQLGTNAYYDEHCNFQANRNHSYYISDQVRKIVQAEEELLHGKYKAKMNIELEEEKDDEAN
mmetsp:Transcript_44386/g.32442  ORF Transcript_44386/g.32442 Transcript_44386/m.32442 type:complete len:117 (+) Transcript_44386:343-693(+)